VTFQWALPAKLNMSSKMQVMLALLPCWWKLFIILTTDFFETRMLADVDAGTGFTLVATPQACFVWQTRRSCWDPHLLHLPLPSRSSQSAPLYAFVPYGGFARPGLILASSRGDLGLEPTLVLVSQVVNNTPRSYWSCSLTRTLIH